jgi:hypothetical protein
MSRDAHRDFSCPRCQARYKIVRLKSEISAVHPMLECKVCQHELAPTEGSDILKYFLVGRPMTEKRQHYRGGDNF